MKLKPNAYFLIFVIILGVVFLVDSLGYPRMQDRLLGTLASAILLFAAAIHLIIGLRRGEIAAETEEQFQGRVETTTILRRTGLVLLWLGGFATATYVLGFLISVPLFLVSYLKWQRTRWLAAIVVAVVTTAFIFAFFEIFLLRTLWRGILPIPWWVIPFL